jgi:hypothetical protein
MKWLARRLEGNLPIEDSDRVGKGLLIRAAPRASAAAVTGEFRCAVRKRPV